ncbi:MAG TPA: glycosyltransferase [Ignavibacteriales bacterium]|nr:glycosyltransferase [Ignavibacteriales bacterium]HOL82076.1 glycosyltransferase [Ignavibacteriales bacterium]HOM66141.1 glycosyltransferase [Ignavibacteriales bacterium]HPD66475.1 glycosyltransferase [Ignavibacteriales bacterium]HPP34190.1 glycosyltransferase [Ignavibacteriales bacterium]
MFYIAAFIILFLNFFILITLKLFIKNSKTHNNFEFLNFSIVVAAKNEENNIENLLLSLKSQNYPKDKFEIIIVDDNSSDKTYEIVCEFAKNNPELKIKPIKATKKKLPAKKGALEIGIANSSFEHILITDADCYAEKDWLISMSKAFSNGADIIIGKAPFFNNQNFIFKISIYENLKTFIVSHFAISLNLAYTATARNFGYTKDIYKQINGYRNTLDTISGDDDLFIREATKINAKIKGLYYNNSCVYSNSKATLKEYYLQKARHTSTSFHYLPKHQIFLLLWHFLSMQYILLSPFIFFNFNLIFPLIASLVSNQLISFIMQKELNYKYNYISIILYDFIYQINLIINIFTGYFYNNKWK